MLANEQTNEMGGVRKVRNARSQSEFAQKTSAQDFETIQKAVTEKTQNLKKLIELIQVIEKQVGAGTSSPSVLTKASKQLELLLEQANAEIPKGVAAAIAKSWRLEAEGFADRVRHALRNLSENSTFEMKLIQDDRYSIGPFELKLNIEKEAASLYYAKTLIATSPLIPQQIVEAVQLNLEAIFAPTADLTVLAKEFEEAMRVALARKEKAWSAQNMRIDLPSLYREILSIRNGQEQKSKKSKPYSLARFVVEMKTLLQSDMNLDGPRTFTPEPAVIENAKDPKKSVFVPRELDAGYGEGTYFQAIVFKNQTLGVKNVL